MSAVHESNQQIAPMSCCPSCGSTQVDSQQCLECGIVLEHFRNAAPKESSPADRFEEPMEAVCEKGRSRSVQKIRWLSLAAAAVLAFLVSLPATAPPVQLDPKALERLENKVTELDSKLEAGRKHTMRVDESEANSWLLRSKTLIQAQKAAEVPESSRRDKLTEGWTGTIPDHLNDLRVRLNGSSLLFHLSYQVLGKEFSLQVEGVPEINQGYLSVRPLNARLGSLPIPGGVVASTVSRIFEPTSRMAQFLLPPQLKQIEVVDGELVFEFDDFLNSLL